MGARVLPLELVTKRRWFFLGTGAFCLLFVGFFYGWSILAVPLQNELGWTAADTSLTFSVSSFLFCIGGAAGAQLSKRTAPHVTLRLSAVLIVIGYFIVSSFGSTHHLVIHVAYGVCVGCSCGMANNAVIGTVNRWFPDKTGVSAGSLTLGYGLSPLILGWAISLAIDGLGWQVTFQIWGVVLAIVLVAASFILFVPLPEQELPVPEKHITMGLEVTPMQMLRQRMFWIIFIFATLCACIYLGVMGNSKQIALEAGATMAVATLGVGTVSLLDGLSRFFAGFFYDRFGYKISFILVGAFFACAPLSLIASFKFGVLPLAFVGFAFLGLGFGSISTALSATMIRFFGQKNYGANLSILFLDFLPAATIGPTVIGQIQTLNNSFSDTFWIPLVFGVAAFVLCLAIAPPKRQP